MPSVDKLRRQLERLRIERKRRERRAEVQRYAERLVGVALENFAVFCRSMFRAVNESFARALPMLKDASKGGQDG